MNQCYRCNLFDLKFLLAYVKCKSHTQQSASDLWWTSCQLRLEFSLQTRTPSSGWFPSHVHQGTVSLQSWTN